MQFRPLHDRVLVKRMDSEEKTSGGIIIPDSAQEKPMEAKVIAVGTGLRSEDGKIAPLDVKKGDIVGTLGSSGRSTGPHLDIRLNWFGIRLDPASILDK